MRLDRLEALIGSDNSALLKTKTILVCGLGGVGSYCAEALARSGLCGLVLADCDVVDPTNANRQLIALDSTIGQMKTDVMRERIADIDPQVVVTTFTERISPDNLERLFAGNPDFVVDAIDDVEAKTALIAYAVARGVPIVSAMGFANKLHPEKIQISTLDKTTVCPLARIVRMKLRDQGLAARVPVVYSTEAPIASRREGIKLGSSAFVPAAAGLFAAAYVINAFIQMEAIRS